MLVQRHVSEDGNGNPNLVIDIRVKNMQDIIECRRIRFLAKVSLYDYTWSLRIARKKRCDGMGG
jgi:hypothetical protein